MRIAIPQHLRQIIPMPELKEISQWKEVDIQELPKGEYDWIDYKSSPWFTLDDKCLNELSKYASAFANYDGGYLIVGIQDPSLTLPLCIDGGVPLSLKKDLKSWLEDKIPSLIDPPINRLGVALLLNESPHSKIKAEHAVVVIKISPSSDAPHQARDKKFYTRLGSKLYPLSTRAILDIAHRISLPKIDTEIFINKHNHRPDWDNLFLRIRNVSNVMARHVAVYIKCPEKMLGMAVRFDNEKLRFTDDHKTYWALHMENKASTPLFPQATFECEFDLRFANLNPNDLQDSIDNIIVRTYADSMPFSELTFEPRSRLRLGENQHRQYDI